MKLAERNERNEMLPIRKAQQARPGKEQLPAEKKRQQHKKKEEEEILRENFFFTMIRVEIGRLERKRTDGAVLRDSSRAYNSCIFS